jgi:hypothetical protein
MSIWLRSSIALGVVLVDLIAFAVPITAIVVAYVVLARPRWFLAWVARLYGESGSRRAGRD